MHLWGQGNNLCVQIFEATAERRCHITNSSVKHTHQMYQDRDVSKETCHCDASEMGQREVLLQKSIVKSRITSITEIQVSQSRKGFLVAVFACKEFKQYSQR